MEAGGGAAVSALGNEQHKHLNKGKGPETVFKIDANKSKLNPEFRHIKDSERQIIE